MSFALEQNESLSLAVKRIAIEQIDLAIEQLSGSSADLNDSIHAARQSLKRIRSLLVLTRNELGDKAFDREWSCYRNAGRLLAASRDAAVVLETFDTVVERSNGELNAEALAPERRVLAERRDALLKMAEEDRALARACDMLVSARERVASWPLRHPGFKVIRRGMRYSCRAGREGLRGVLRHPNPTNFHEWRRPVKLLWHQLQILTPIWPVVLRAHADELHALSDRLNENHDLDALRHAALWSKFEARPQDRRTLVSLVDRRCRQLEAEALMLGERLYSERPRRFAERLERYWQAWRRGHRNGATVPVQEGEIAAAAGAQKVL